MKNKFGKRRNFMCRKTIREIYKETLDIIGVQLFLHLKYAYKYRTVSIVLEELEKKMNKIEILEE